MDLVHQLDQLKAERHRVLTFMNEKIALVEGELRAIAEASERISRGVTPGSKIADKVLEALRANPGCDYELLAKLVYGEDNEKVRARLRSQVTFLAKQKRIRPVAERAAGGRSAKKQQPMRRRSSRAHLVR